MSLLDVARADNMAILALDCDDITLTAPTVGTVPGAVYALQGQVLRVGVDTNADGLPIAVDKATATVSLEALAAQGLTNPDDLKAKGWTASTGSTSFRVDQVLLDRSLGRVTMILKRTS